jgi:hypothetical protein
VVCGAILTAGAGQAAIVLDGLLVRVYDNAGVPAAERARALSRAGEILARVELDVAWLDCPARGAEAIPRQCNTAPDPDEIIVRLVRASARADLDYHQALGYSLVDSETGRGTIATVFADRVEHLAHLGRFDRASVMGRAVAHEIGHLILGTNAHSDRGLMREHWTFEEVKRNRPEDWQFTAAQREELRDARLSGASSARAAKARPGAGTGGYNPLNLLNKTP